jgi:hypothetical protein
MRELLREEALFVSKRLLLELVGYQNDAAGAWGLIRDAFEDGGGDPDSLYVKRFAHTDRIVLTLGESEALTS